MYRTIMVPLENSPTDAAILAHVRPLARMAGSALVLVHVADGHVARTQEALNLHDSSEIEDDRAYLSRREGELAAEGFAVKSVLEKGDPTRGLLAVAARERPDLIAMATHGHGLIGDLMRGSVAEQLRHRTEIPVLMVRGGKPGQSGEGKG